MLPPPLPSLLLLCLFHSLISAVSLLPAANASWELKATSHPHRAGIPRSWVLVSLLSPTVLSSPPLSPAEHPLPGVTLPVSLGRAGDMTPYILIPSALCDQFKQGSSASLLFNSCLFLSRKRHFNWSFGKQSIVRAKAQLVYWREKKQGSMLQEQSSIRKRNTIIQLGEHRRLQIP